MDHQEGGFDFLGYMAPKSEVLALLWKWDIVPVVRSADFAGLIFKIFFSHLSPNVVRIGLLNQAASRSRQRLASAVKP